MGVLGLWTLIEPAGKPVTLESLENKILAIDVSIWLNQAVKGFRDRSGNAMPNAHLLGLYHRICKLLFYKIKPVFVFDGPAPQLKRETINRRRQHRSKDAKKAKQASAKILDNYLKSQAIAQQLKRQTLAVDKVVKQGSEGISSLLHSRIAKKEKDLFELPELPKDAEVFVESSEESSDSETEGILRRLGLDEVSDVHQVDVTSDKFSSLPKTVQYDLLTELKDKRKQNSWAKMHEMPQKAEGFSGFQLERLKRRRQVQKKLEDVEAQLNEETSRNFKTNPNLFVGDKEGILKAKTEVRKIASQSDRHIVFMSGLSGLNNDEGEDVDDPEDVSRVVAESMLDHDDLSQAEILNLIKAPKNVGEGSKDSFVDLGSDSDDDVILLPSGSVIQSNRFGGRPTSRANRIDEFERAALTKIEDIKPLVEDLKHLVEKPKTNEGIVISFDIPKRKDDVEEMSDSSSDESDDLFADVFDAEQNVESLDDILAKAVVPNASMTTAQNSDIKIDERKGDFDNVFGNEMVPKAVKRVAPKNEVDELIEIASKFDKAKDIFADISKRARKASLEPPKIETNNAVTQDIAKSLKSSDHLFMKIAGRWADDAAAKSPVKVNNTEAAKTPTKINKVTLADAKKTDLAADLEVEQNKLIKEMEEKEKESRLMKFQNLNYDQPEHSEPQILKRKIENSEPQIQKRKIENNKKSLNQDAASKPHSISKDEVKALQKLGVTSKDSDTYKDNVLIEEGLAPSSSSSSSPPPSSSTTIYSASVPGFVRSGKDALNTVDVSNIGDNDGVELSEELANALVKKSGGDAEITEDELYAIQARLAKEQESLVAERAKAERIASSLTDQMYMECQELLQMFGVPWIVAPSEAEAQCAFLETVGLTHGTITDDSDVWLFGGIKVYKNFFNQDKHVECFGAAEIQQHFGLDREKLSLLAMLTGSDYSDGVEGVGPVTALEILAEFPGKGINPLKDFREWWDKSHKDYAMPIGSKRREKFRKLNLPSRFPNDAILAAYLTPQVDESGEKFSWAVPNLVEVRDFAMDKFGWGKLQIDQLLKPVIRSLENNKSQSRIDNYFHSFRTVLPDKGHLQASKRVQDAIRQVRGDKIEAVEKKKSEKSKRKAPVKKKKIQEPSETSNPEVSLNGQSSAESSNPEVSLIAQSCGFVISASKDDIILQKQEREQKAREAKEKAAEIFKKSQMAKQNKLKKKFKRPQRKELVKHDLSESDSD